jgi:hypothetical protein
VEIRFVGDRHSANRVGFEVFPDQFIGIAVGRVGRKIELGDMGGASIGELKIAAAASSPKQGADSPFAS